MSTAFTVLEFKNPDVPDLVYLEQGYQESIQNEDQDAVDRYTRRFADLVDVSKTGEDLPALLDEVANYRFAE